MSSLEIYEEYRRIIAIEQCDRANKHLVDNYQDQQVIIDDSYEEYQRSLGIDV